MSLASLRKLGLMMVMLLAVSPSFFTSTAMGQGGSSVEMRDFEFAPKSITVAAGTTINFPNTGQAPHTATADNGSFDTGRVDAGGSASLTFNTPGTYPYYCVYHGAAGGVGMAGTIVVRAAAEQGPATQQPSASTRPAATPAPAAAPAVRSPAPAAQPAAGAASSTTPAARPAAVVPATGAAPTDLSWLAIWAVLLLLAGFGLVRRVDRHEEEC